MRGARDAGPGKTLALLNTAQRGARAQVLEKYSHLLSLSLGGAESSDRIIEIPQHLSSRSVVHDLGIPEDQLVDPAKFVEGVLHEVTNADVP